MPVAKRSAKVKIAKAKAERLDAAPDKKQKQPLGFKGAAPRQKEVPVVLKTKEEVIHQHDLDWHFLPGNCITAWIHLHMGQVLELGEDQIIRGPAKIRSIVRPVTGLEVQVS